MFAGFHIQLNYRRLNMGKFKSKKPKKLTERQRIIILKNTGNYRPSKKKSHY